MKKIIPALLVASRTKADRVTYPTALTAFEDELRKATGGIGMGDSSGSTYCTGGGGHGDQIDDAW